MYICRVLAGAAADGARHARSRACSARQRAEGAGRVCMYVFMYVYMYTYIDMYMYMYICTYILGSAVRVSVRKAQLEYICIYVSMYKCVVVHLYMFICNV